MLDVNYISYNVRTLNRAKACLLDIFKEISLVVTLKTDKGGNDQVHGNKLGSYPERIVLVFGENRDRFEEY